MSRSPDYILKAFNKVTSKPLGKIGAGWDNKDGSITVVLNPFTVIQQEEDIVFTLFPHPFMEDAKIEGKAENEN